MRVTVGITPFGSTEEFDATEYLVSDGAVSTIRNTIDNSDFVVGVFSYSSCRITLKNLDGKFSEDEGLLFLKGRDESVVRIRLLNETTGDSNLVFTGLINDDATRENDFTETISFVALPRESVLSRTNYSTGSILDGTTFTEAIQSLLFQAKIFAPRESIDLDIEGEIENSEAFEGESIQDSLNQILVASNSILYTNAAGEFFITKRTDPRRTSLTTVYGPFDEFGRTPTVLKVKDLNNGKHRMINQVTFNEVPYNEQTFIDFYGLRKKEFEAPFITSAEQRRRIATNLLEKYRYPKREMVITLPMKDTFNMNLSSIIQVDYTRRVETTGDDFARYGIAEYGVDEYPDEIGRLNISSQIGWIVYELSYDFSNFIVDIKLREKGFSLGDEAIRVTKPTAVYGESQYGGAVYA